MIILDLRTALFSYIGSSILCVVVMVFLWLENRRRLKGLDFWLGAFILEFLAVGLLSLRGSAPDSVAIIIPNVSAVGGTILLYMGLERYVGKVSAQYHNYLLLVVFTCLHTYFTYLHPSQALRDLNSSLCLLLICLQCTWLLLRRAEGTIKSEVRVVGFGIAVYSLGLLVRAVAVLAFPQSTDPANLSFFETLAILGYQIILVAMTFGLLLMVNRRLFAALEDDIAVRKQVEQTLKESEARLVQAQAVAHVGSWEVDLATNISWASEEAFRIYGLERNSPYLPLEQANQLVNPEDRPRLEATLRKLVAGEKVYDLEYRLQQLDKDLQPRVIHTIAHLVRDAQGKPAKVVGVIQDITERKRAEVMLLDSEERYRTLLDNLGEGIGMADFEGCFTFANPRANEIMGVAPGSLVGRNLDEFVDAAVLELMEKRAEDQKMGKADVYELEIIRPDGERRTLQVNSRPQTDGQGNYVGIFAVFHDITERKQVDDALRESEERFRQVVKTASDAILTINEDGKIIAWNSGAEIIFQYREDEIIGKPITQLIPPLHQEKHTSALKSIVAGGEPNISGQVTQVSGLRKDGIEIPIELSLSTWKMSKGQLFTAVIRDITERKLVEEVLQRQSTHDTLTGLFNRQYYEDEIIRLQMSRRFPITILMMDVDGLKQVNDSRGHHAGDELLRRVAEVLKNTFRPEDLVARMGGDEFVVVLPNTSHPTGAQVVQRLKRNIEKHNQDHPSKYSLILSIGMACGEHGTLLSEVFAEADRDMYREKGRKKLAEE